MNADSPYKSVFWHIREVVKAIVRRIRHQGAPGYIGQRELLLRVHTALRLYKESLSTHGIRLLPSFQSLAPKLPSEAIRSLRSARVRMFVATKLFDDAAKETIQRPSHLLDGATEWDAENDIACVVTTALWTKDREEMLEARRWADKTLESSSSVRARVWASFFLPELDAAIGEAVDRHALNRQLVKELDPIRNYDLYGSLMGVTHDDLAWEIYTRRLAELPAAFISDQLVTLPYASSAILFAMMHWHQLEGRPFSAMRCAYSSSLAMLSSGVKVSYQRQAVTAVHLTRAVKGASIPDMFAALRDISAFKPRTIYTILDSVLFDVFQLPMESIATVVDEAIAAAPGHGQTPVSEPAFRVLTYLVDAGYDPVVLEKRLESWLPQEGACEHYFHELASSIVGLIYERHNIHESALRLYSIEARDTKNIVSLALACERLKGMWRLSTGHLHYTAKSRLIACTKMMARQTVDDVIRSIVDDNTADPRSDAMTIRDDLKRELSLNTKSMNEAKRHLLRVRMELLEDVETRKSAQQMLERERSHVVFHIGATLELMRAGLNKGSVDLELAARVALNELREMLAVHQHSE